MAGANKNANTKKGANAKAKQAPAEKKGLSYQAVLAVIMGGISALMIYAAFFTKPDTAMYPFFEVLRGLGGDLYVLLPIVPMWLCALFSISATGRRVSVWKSIAYFTVFLCVMTAVEAFFLKGVKENSTVILSWADFVVKSFRAKSGGGAIGALLGCAMFTYLGAWGTFISTLVIITLMLLATGVLQKAVVYIRARSHDDGQRRMVRRNDAMFESDEESLLDDMFDRKPVRRPPPPKPQPAQPARRQAPSAPSAKKPRAKNNLYIEDIAGESDAIFTPTVKAAEEKPLPEPIDAPVIPKDKPVKEKVIKEKPIKEEDKPIEQMNISDLKIEPDEYELPDAPEMSEPESAVPFDVKPMLKLKKVDDSEKEEVTYNYPPIDLLAEVSEKNTESNTEEDMRKAKILDDMLKSFGILTKLTGIAHGPAVTRFELQPAPGIKVSKITGLSENIALNLAAVSVRIEAPIPGKAAVGVEVPNDNVETVPLREVLESADARKHTSRIAVGLGKDNSGRYIVADIAKMPHVLIAGQTGSGKSVCINSIIVSILYRATPDEVKLILIDPKVVELSVYNQVPHLIAPVVTDPKKAASALDWAVAEMTTRYKKFAESGVRDIKGYNKARKPDEKPMPHIVIIIDELADLMMVAPGEVEDSICRLAQLARAAGMHLVIATQRPSVNVITGIIKANIPTRIAFLVSSQVDSRTIIDHGGAEKLLGYGDMLFVPSGIQKPMRVQGSWVSDEEVHSSVEYIKERSETDYDEDVLEHINNGALSDAEKDEVADEYDSRLPEAVEIVVEAGQASISMLQRRMRVGYARAGRLIDVMAQRGIVSEADGAKPRNVLITREQYQRMFEDDEK